MNLQNHNQSNHKNLTQTSFMRQPLWYFIKENHRSFSLGVLFLALTNIFDGIGPYILKQGIDQIVKDFSLNQTANTVLLYIVVMVLLTTFRYYWRVTFGRYHTEAGESLRLSLFDHFLNQSPRYFKKTPIGEIMSIISNDVNTFRQAIGPGLLIFLDAIFMSLVIIPLMCSMNLNWTLRTMVIVPFVPLFIYFIHKYIHKFYRKQQDRLAELSAFSQELVTGIRPIKGFNQESNKLEAYNKISKAFEKSSNKVAIVDGLFMPVMDLGVALGSVILLFIAVPELIAGTVTIGTFIAFQRYIDRMVWPMTALGIGVSNFQRGKAAFDRIRNALLEKPEVNDDGCLLLNHFSNLTVENVCFSYDKDEIQQLKNINFSLNKGETLGITGPIGSGKSTLINLLVRFYEPQNGRILINGEPISNFKISSLRKQIRLISQDPFLFSDTIKNNFLFPRDNPEFGESAESLAEKVHLKAEINELPLGFESELGEKGVNLSGGQKQRLTIGRGWSEPAELLIIDDSLSAVDFKTEALINAEFDRLKKMGQTVIIISHRLNNLSRADKVLVLREGKVEAFGTPNEVIAQSETLKFLSSVQGVQL